MGGEPLEYWPADAEVPASYETDRVRLEPLTTAHNERDYAAVMASAERLRTQTDGRWPSSDFSSEENLEDLARHEAEHESREAFTYTILSKDGERCLGCLYLRHPVHLLGRGVVTEGTLSKRDHTTTADFWMVPEATEAGIEAELFDALRQWLAEAWPFEQVWWTTVEADPAQNALFAAAGQRAFVLEGTADRVVYVGYE